MLVALFGVACTSEASPPVSTAQLTTTVAETNTTTEPATTTTTEPTTTAPPTSSQEEIEAELIAVIEGSYQVFEGDPDSESPRVELFFTGELKSSVSSNLAEDELAGIQGFGGFELLFTESVSIDGDEAVLVACGVDALGAMSAGGDVLVEPDEVGFLRHYYLSLGADGDWRIARITFGEEKTECAP